MHLSLLSHIFSTVPRKIFFQCHWLLPHNITVNPLLHSFSFIRINNRHPSKTLWEMKKLLVMSGFFFSHNVFYISQTKFQFLSHIYFANCKCFEFGQVQTFENQILKHELLVQCNNHPKNLNISKLSPPNLKILPMCLIYPITFVFCNAFNFNIGRSLSFRYKVNPFPNNKDSSKLREFADNNSKFGENGRKFSKQVENTVGKGEIACHEQFLFVPQCFLKAFTGKRVKSSYN